MRPINIIAIDCGASFLKAALFREGHIVRESSCKAPEVHKEEDIFTPCQITALVSRVREVLTELSEGLSEAVVCISNEMHGFILAHEDGSPFTDYISWQKEYGNNKLDGISSKEILEKEEYRDDILKSGMPVRAGLPSSNLLFLKRSGALDRTDERVYFYTLGDYIIRVLSGKQPVCHLTNAAASGLTDLVTGKWNERLIELVCGDRVVFPEIGTDTVTASPGDTAFSFLPAVGDQQAALYGAGLDSENDLSFNLGTGAQVSKIADVRLSAAYQTRPYMNGRFIRSIPHLPSGRAMNVYIRFIKDVLMQFGSDTDEAEIWEKVICAVDRCSGSTPVCDLSFFENPITDHITGSINNIAEYGLETGSLFKGVFNAMTDNFLWAASVIEPEKANVRRLVFSGGVAKRLDYIRNRISDGYKGAEIRTAPDKETLYGLWHCAIDLLNMEEN